MLTYANLGDMTRHQTGCQCLALVGDATDARIRATAHQIRAIGTAHKHGASLRQIAEVAGVSHDHVRQIVNAMGDDEAVALPLEAEDAQPAETPAESEDTSSDSPYSPTPFIPRGSGQL